MCCKPNTIVFIIILDFFCYKCFVAQCGRVKRVVGAVELECGTQPRIGSLRNTSNLEHICGATILSPHYALTSAHCVTYGVEQYILQLNNYCVNDSDEPPRAEILEIIRHPSYDPISIAHDVAVLRIALHLDDLTWLNQTLLPTSSFGLSGDCTIYGYGYRDVDTMETSERLLAGSVRIVSLDECTDILGPYVAPQPDSGMMCAVGDDVDACQGDSGSPLICTDGTIEGVSSYGMSCAVPGIPGVYLSVGAHLSWIREVIQIEQ